jgi:AcrR family transcriptional regulator
MLHDEEIEDSMSVSRRDHLVETAMKLFCKQGFRATGIDAVLSESGVAKKTLYNHFRSKDELIIAVLQRRDEDFMSSAREGVARLAPEQEGPPQMARILAFFDVVAEWANSDGFNGCTFINASAEFPRRDDPIHVACMNHKRFVLRYIEELISGLELAEPQRVARELSLLVEGAIVIAFTCSDPSGVVVAKDAARRLCSGVLESSA